MNYSKFREIRNINSEIISPAFDRAGLYFISSDLDHCGDFSVMYDCTSCGTREWKGFTRCKNKFCLCCNVVKSLSWLAKTYGKFEKFLQEGKYIVMLTLTIRDRANLAESMGILNKAWKYFYCKDKDSAKEFKRRFIGGIKSIEVKIGEDSGLWHPHLHCLLIKDRFCYDKAFLDAAWSRCVELAGGEVDEKINYIESIFMRDKNGVKTYDKEALMKGIVEAVKYITKFDYAGETPERLQKLVSALDGVRHIDTFGCCRNIHKDVKDELNKEVKLNETVRHVCQVCGCDEAKLIQMLTNSIEKSERIIFTEPDQVTIPLGDKMIDFVKSVNGKLPQSNLISDSDKKQIEDMYYQSTMFDLHPMPKNRAKNTKRGKSNGKR